MKFKKWKLGLAVLMVALVAAVVVRWRMVPSSSDPVPLEVLDEQGYHFETTENDLALISPEGKVVDVPDEVKKKFSEREQASSFVLPVIDNGSAIVVSTLEIIEGQWTESGERCLSRNRLYTYHFESKKLEEVYAEESRSGSPFASETCRILRVAGKVGNQLVILIDDPDNSPGVCTNIWGSYPDNFLVFDVERKLLTPYTVPAEKVEEGRTEEKRCLEDFDS